MGVLIFFSLSIVSEVEMHLRIILHWLNVHDRVSFYSIATTVKQPHPVLVSEKAKSGQPWLRVGFQSSPG